MTQLQAIIILLLIGLCYVTVKGLTCYECVNAASNEECQRVGSLRRCQENEKLCITEIRKQVGTTKTKITKRCKQAKACMNLYRQNSIGRYPGTYRQCAWEQGSNYSSTVCRCCCASNQCNSGLYDACRAETRALAPEENEVRCFPITGFPVNGKQKCSRKNLPSSHCHFTCDENYILHGEKDISCQKRSAEIALWSGEVPCCASVCPPYETIDLIIAIQSSGYAEEEYSIVKTFLVDLIKEMVQLTSSDTRVKLFSFQEKPDPFGRSPKIGFKSPYAVIEKVEELKMSKGKGSSWFWTLNLIQKMVFAPNFGNREDAKDFIVLIVKDLPTDDSLYDATIPARQLRDEGVKIIVIGILPHDSTTTRELFISKLFQITGSRDKIIIADGGAESFNDKLPSLPQALCGQPCSD